MVHRVRPRRGRRYRAFVFYKHLIPPGFLNESNYAQVLTQKKYLFPHHHEHFFVALAHIKMFASEFFFVCFQVFAVGLHLLYLLRIILLVAVELVDGLSKSVLRHEVVAVEHQHPARKKAADQHKAVAKRLRNVAKKWTKWIDCHLFFCYFFRIALPG